MPCPLSFEPSQSGSGRPSRAGRRDQVHTPSSEVKSWPLSFTRPAKPAAACKEVLHHSPADYRHSLPGAAHGRRGRRRGRGRASRSGSPCRRGHGHRARGSSVREARAGRGRGRRSSRGAGDVEVEVEVRVFVAVLKRLVRVVLVKSSQGDGRRAVRVDVTSRSATPCGCSWPCWRLVSVTVDVDVLVSVPRAQGQGRRCGAGRGVGREGPGCWCPKP